MGSARSVVTGDGDNDGGDGPHQKCSFSHWKTFISPTQTLRHLLPLSSLDDAGDDEETEAKQTPASSSSSDTL